MTFHSPSCACNIRTVGHENISSRITWVCAVSLDETSRVTPNLSSFRETDLQVLLATRTMEVYVLHNKRSCSSLLLLPPPPPTPSSLWFRLLSAECSFSGKHRNATKMLSCLSSRASAARQSRQGAKKRNALPLLCLGVEQLFRATYTAIETSTRIHRCRRKLNLRDLQNKATTQLREAP